MKYIRLPNGEKTECYDCIINGGTCLIKFVNTNIDDIKDFLGTEIIDYIDLLNEDESLEKSFDIYARRKQLLCDDEAIVQKKEYRIIKEASTEVLPAITDKSGNILQEEQTISIPEDVEIIYKDIPVEMITAVLEKPGLEEELHSIKEKVGIANPNNMTLEEFKVYYKSIIGEKCTAAIYNGCSVETSIGCKHFSYTLQDQSNLKDLFILLQGGLNNTQFPYHADKEPCMLYSAADIAMIYSTLSVHKLYHTTYCNILNSIIDSQNSISAIKAITYGMEITEDSYKTLLCTLTSQGEKVILKSL